MGHRIVDAIIEDGQLKYVSEKLPAGRLEVHLIYDRGQERTAKRRAMEIVKRTAGFTLGLMPLQRQDDFAVAGSGEYGGESSSGYGVVSIRVRVLRKHLEISRRPLNLTLLPLRQRENNRPRIKRWFLAMWKYDRH